MTATNFGGEGYFNVWTPFVLHPREQSLAQMAVTAKTAGGVRQTIEAGWQDNALQRGWVQTSPTFTPGSIVTPTSVIGGEQVELYLRIELHQGHWWVRRDNEWVGYFPASLFAPDGLQTQASWIHFSGETSDDPNIPGMTVSDMGSGKRPLQGKAWQRNTAYMHHLQYQVSPQAWDRKRYLPELIEATNKNCPRRASQ
jgi:hypothetical protein